jgi:cellulose 1,4-beta-cellobiosidase
MAVGAVAVAGVAVLPTLPAFAAVSCNVRWDVQNSWSNGGASGGAQVTPVITNTGDAWTSWTLTFAFPSGETFNSGWSANYTPSGGNLTMTNLSWNGSVPTGGTVGGPPGFILNWTGTQPSATSDTPAPASFTVNGVTCGGTTLSNTLTTTTTRPPTSTTTTSRPPTTTTTSRPPTSTTTTSRPPTSTTTTATCPAPCTRADNPYANATVYNNPEWRANALASGASTALAGVGTAVWMDRIAASGGANGAMGLVQHLDAAVAQDGANGATPLVFQFVVYNLPGRDCAALASNGELGKTEIDRYRNDYINPIADILRRPAYANLRIVAIVEIDSLPNLVTNAGGEAGATQNCRDMLANGNYVAGVRYALQTLGAIPNVYNYIDAAHHGWLGWSSNFDPSGNLFRDVVTGATGGWNNVTGFIANTANYSALQEQFFNINTSVNGQSVRNSTWVGFNDYVDELTYAQAFRTMMIGKGAPSTLGMLIDTSRNGWGGSARPTAASTSTDVNMFVDQSRIDRRIHVGNWCNQSGAGLGERPRAAPATGIDAYVWVKPPGESDGASQAINNDEGKGFDQMCAPGTPNPPNPRNGNGPSGALANAPLSGHWFDAQFRQLMQNAFPPL